MLKIHLRIKCQISDFFGVCSLPPLPENTTTPGYLNPPSNLDMKMSGVQIQGIRMVKCSEQTAPFTTRLLAEAPVVAWGLNKGFSETAANFDVDFSISITSVRVVHEARARAWNLVLCNPSAPPGHA